ncbi:centrosomal protein of 89 kDa isoform X1 [Monodelphis domestica]|uniref:Centrosomal protein 89 n=1 Tax=Monodelphis domestica TaxID=13616 RepID=A0A5F8GZ21_MONDO|nr:centrosomal protein of 89 kDa isoform X1 [Monodelphis domestica]
MPLGLRRDSRSQFKHIVHGLIPAATIAPRPAVPRTPPPRSPDPSPERPRSALAAAILASTLTGRTFAIPQPFHRSHSESDKTYLEGDSGVIEPYATVTEFKQGAEWQDDQGKRYSLPNFKMSGYNWDEDVETYVSDNSSVQVEPRTRKKEKNFENTIYAVPHKNNKDTVTLIYRTYNERDETASGKDGFPDLQAESLKVKGKHPLQNLKDEKLSAENVIFEKPPPFPDVSNRKHQEQMELSKHNFDELKQENFYLITTNETLAHELEEIKQEMKDLYSKFKEMEKDNENIKENEQRSEREVDMAEFLSLRQQAQELVDENDDLKMMIYRLNVELSRYQTKFRPLPKEENMEIKGLPFKASPPPWLLDRKYLSPLLLAYEDRMKEKDDLNVKFEEEMKMFKLRTEEVIKENETLHRELNKNSSVTSKEWNQLQSQAQLVLEENNVLMQQLEIQQAKAKDNNQQHSQEVSKLTKQQVLLENKIKNQEKELAENHEQLEFLHSKCQNLKIQLESRIEVKVHETIMNELKSQLKKEEEKWSTESENLITQMSLLQAQNKSLLLEKSRMEAENKVLGAELERAKKLNRGSQKQIDLLQHQVEESMEKEEVAHQYLTNFIVLANAIAQERDNLVHLAQCLEIEKQGVLYKIIEGNFRLGRLEEKVKVYKKKAAVQLGDFNHRMTKQEEDFCKKINHYQQEMKHLQQLLQDKQETLEEVLQQKREVEGELEVVWESTAKENQRMKEFLCSTLQKTHVWKESNVYGSCLNKISKEELVEGYTVSFCEVKSSSSIQVPETPALYALCQTESSDKKETASKADVFLHRETNLY